MGKQSKFAIMSNELKRRLDVLNENIDGAEKKKSLTSMYSNLSIRDMIGGKYGKLL